jgi:hypothetical protein
MQSILMKIVALNIFAGHCNRGQISWNWVLQDQNKGRPCILHKILSGQRLLRCLSFSASFLHDAFHVTHKDSRGAICPESFPKYAQIVVPFENSSRFGKNEYLSGLHPTH